MNKLHYCSYCTVFVFNTLSFYVKIMGYVVQNGQNTKIFIIQNENYL